MPQECMVDLIVVVFLRQKECGNSHRTGTDQRHLYRLKRIHLSKENRQQRQADGKNRLDQEHGSRSADVVHHSPSLIHNVGHGRKIRIQSTTLAMFFAASLPSAMATLQSASFECQNIVDTISVMATVCPWGFQRKHHLAFLLRRHAAEHAALFHCFLKLFLRVDRSRINEMIRIFQGLLFLLWKQPSPDHLRRSPSDPHPGCQKRQRFRRLLPDHIGQEKQRYGF